MKNKPLILFFTKFFNEQPCLPEIGAGLECDFTDDRAQMASADAVVFHLPNLDTLEGITKAPGQLWVAWSMETSNAYPIMRDPDAMSRFDLRMTYQQDADVWTPYLASATRQGLLKPPLAKTESSPVVRFQSNPFNNSGRNEFASVLMTRIKVDSYGSVANNRSLDGPDRGVQTMVETIARYKFTLAFENASEPDYVTEKFFNPLIAGSVPVYLGAPNIEEFAPGKNCFVDVTDFSGVDDLAAYLNYLDTDDEAYGAYLAWKSEDALPSYRAMLDRVAEPAFHRLSKVVAAKRAATRRLGGA